MIVKSDGMPYASEASAKQQLRAKGFQDTHEVVRAYGGFALEQKDNSKLSKGDKVRILSSDNPEWVRFSGMVGVVTHVDVVGGPRIDFNGPLHDGSDYWLIGDNTKFEKVENGVAKAADTDQPMNTIQTLRQARETRDKAEKAFQEALKAVRAELGSEFVLSDVAAKAEVKDLPPEEWQAGDLVECVDDKPMHCHQGGIYTVNRGLEGFSISIIHDDDGDLGLPPASSFKFHSRPSA